jgi:hypothetical protein
MPHLGRRLTHLEHDARKFLWPDDNQRHDSEYDELAGVKIEHQKTSPYRRFWRWDLRPAPAAWRTAAEIFNF